MMYNSLMSKDKEETKEINMGVVNDSGDDFEEGGSDGEMEKSIGEESL